MYRLIREKLMELGVNVVEEELDQSLGYCEVSKDKPVIHIAKNLDEMNKIGVLFHEAIHASSYWTKRTWWFHYRSFAERRFFYMEESLALQKQLEISNALGLNDTYSTMLANKLYDRNIDRIGGIDMMRIDRENDKVNAWLLNTFKGISNDLDRHLYKATFVPSSVRDSNLSTGVGAVSAW